MRGVMILRILFSSLIFIFLHAPVSRAGSTVFIKAEMLVVYNHPQPAKKFMAGGKPYVAYIRLGKTETKLINKLTTKPPLTINNMPARFVFTGYLHWGESNSKVASNRELTLEIEQILEILQLTKFSANELDPKWADLKKNDPKAALSALQYIDRLCEEQMTEDEVLRLFPPGSLIKTKPHNNDEDFSLSLNKSLSDKILGANSHTFYYAYSISFDKQQKLKKTHLMLNGDI